MGYGDISQLIKDIRALAEKAHNSELSNKLIELQGMVMDAQAANFDLVNENHELKEQLDYTNRLDLDKSGALILDGDSSKLYCTKCWGNSRKLNLVASGFLYDSPVYQCAACNQMYGL